MNPQKRKKYLVLASSLVLVFFLFFLYSSRKGKLFFSAPQIIVSSGTVAFGDSLFAILVEKNISPDESQNVIQTFSSVFNPRRCQPGDSYKILKSTGNDFISLEYEDGSLNIYKVKKDISGDYVANREEINLEKKLVGLKGEIKTSLYEAIIEQGGNAELAMKFADIFAWQIDFLTETRAGDTYEFVWEKYENENKKINFDGNILVGRYQGKESSVHTALLYEDEKGNSDYYNLKGESLRKEFLRAPLNYRRISSYFSYRRFHPILRYLRPHLAIDYAAPEGTPVASIGDGIVTFCGWESGYGRLVIVRHNNVYSSYYGHLSRYGRGIKTGVKVKQGQVIGYVGATGLATGPHLDFRMKKYGQFVNFLKIKLPSVKLIRKEEIAKFEEMKKEKLTQLARIASKGE
ncbi:MAG TPA: peptidase M23 [Elusimicrobia bacterium]|jgi:murein DD-endopeptidase MepM/ murein hydrolase activator NlpD|nr:peptidase M23 [Elusimicrobiota bacterium]